MTGTARLPVTQHPLRPALYDELHSRPFPLVPTPRQISYLAVKGSAEEISRGEDLVKDLCRRYGVHPPAPKAPSFQGDFGGFTLEWERHMEFYSLSILGPCTPNGELFRHPPLELLPADWVSALPGEVVSALHMVVVDDESCTDPDSLNRNFEGHRLIISEAGDRKARIHTAFRLHGDGFGRFLVLNMGMSDTQMGRLARRLLEIETYRLLSQLSLPIAKRLAPLLEGKDGKLADLLELLPRIGNVNEERELLQKLSQTAACLESWRAESNHRFSATRAYHELVNHRLRAIREEKVEGHMTIAEFMSRRLDPALRTCVSTQEWMEDLSRRIERAGDLLRTRVNLALQEQNQGLLASMNRRARLQFRLQETVEGLSVVAISYYLIGLISYLLAGLPLDAAGMEKKTVLALLVPVVLGSVWWVTHRIKHRLIKAPCQEA